jgi:hypothetical protein
MTQKEYIDSFKKMKTSELCMEIMCVHEYSDSPKKARMLDYLHRVLDARKAELEKNMDNVLNNEKKHG